VLFAHCGDCQRFTSVYLGEHLASQGFVVMAIEYADDVLNPAEGLDPAVYYDRPAAITWQIDYAGTLTASGGALEGMIDLERVAVIGHSLGGYAALAAAGARLFGEATLCGEEATDGCAFTDDLAALAGLEAPPEGLWPSWGDPRVDVIVPVAPVSRFFGTEGVREVSIPVMIVGGSGDTQTIPEEEFYPLYENLGSANKSLVILDHAEHQIIWMSCDIVPWVYAMGMAGFFYCSDPVWDMNRAHDLINHFTTAFLLAVLKDDTEAAAALAPDAAQFPGITYETTGF
jgi:predicted dienelactone hydrolase